MRSPLAGSFSVAPNNGGPGPVTEEGGGGGPWQGWCASPKPTLVLASGSELPALSSAPFSSFIPVTRRGAPHCVAAAGALSPNSFSVCGHPSRHRSSNLFIHSALQPGSAGRCDGIWTSVLVKKCPELHLAVGSPQVERAMPRCTCFAEWAASFFLRAPTPVHTPPVCP